MVVPLPVRSEKSCEAPFVLGGGARISAAGPGADAMARRLRDGLASDGRRELEVVHEPPAFGEIAIVIAEHEGPEGQREEGHTLEVSAEGVRIGAATATGAFWGVQTLRQLVPTARADDPLTIEAVRIQDYPRFAYRGAMLDVARHFFPPADIRRFIDAIALLKINHLHLHLTDDQGWRIEIESWPELTRIAGSTGSDGSPGGYYTQDEYRALVDYAAKRHITIVPEIDVPGHTNAALASYPELNPDGVAKELYTGRKVGFSSLMTDDATTDRFLRDVVREFAALTPSPYFHIGGDECLSTPAEDFRAFIERAAGLVAETGKTPVGWHEMGRSDRLPRGTIGQYWSFRTPRDKTGEKILSFVRQGGSVIMSPADVAYLDMVYEKGDAIGLDWANGPTDLRSAYGWEPARVVPGLSESHILGVEGPLWTETVPTIEDAEEMVFPRLAAVAEIGWSATPYGTDSARDFDDFATRVARLAEQLGRPRHPVPEGGRPPVAG
ncbi:beta-N-acetylhexosaminidase [Leifsonia xyli subsp. xyli str. CTCB07]|uniref:beta-N-acetylhexosaminidase n=1 Tax=Leifsonia xyli subsp. xyli (strain CTCB07) TaxID=281090 RepID=Q6ADE9_LEIXX|nr:beta-N-acetylhexosaminidase [Leifsonia xyli]AAT89596.1 beta-N-acetylhexosaminidase [Leifsonia xyli subsp. xyli str. CTCB07]